MSNGPKRESKRAKDESVAIRPSSGNVFEDLGLPDSGQALVKAELAARIADAIEKRHLTQAAAAKILEIDQPSVSDLMRGHLRGPEEPCEKRRDGERAILQQILRADRKAEMLRGT